MMLGRSVGLAATWALVANAFLLPPGTETATDRASDLSITVADPNTQVVRLECSSCVFPSKQEQVAEAEDENIFRAQGGANTIILNFTTSDDGHAVALNGVNIYPPHFPLDTMDHRDFYVNQVPASASIADIQEGKVASTPLRISGSGLSIAGEHAVSRLGDHVVPMRFQIMGLENQPMTINEVEIKVLKNRDGQLLILSTEQIENTAGFFDALRKPEFEVDALPMFGHHHGPPPPAECSMLPALLCKWKQTVESKMHGSKPSKSGGCAGHKGGKGHKAPGHVKPHFGQMDEEDGSERHGLPHGMRPHGPHGPHDRHRGPHGHRAHRHHHVLHAFVKGMVAVLIPVMAGITVGMFVSLVGLLVGRLIGFLWITFARGGRRGYARVALQKSSAEQGECEKMIVGEDELEPLPVYEEAPAYEESPKRET